ncbi:hypothetical protein BO82DRAFT_98804 [Aspergillus uvarum CBS 121591]|uniref:Uncharacterized protein n=1 Tax=Aspergillus uvarum CBS 121591 TaxID=1448315 RepID=A0A319C6B8_9EURO|nr:hypothetical protein BO82DRAFT_98804 [Aspergillus uvarum CBS 121591]PYH80825.1 hypothetical protein BO82DRAFT_98804 [Aspergillus uvarum CBS 121591]
MFILLRATLYACRFLSRDRVPHGTGSSDTVWNSSTPPNSFLVGSLQLPQRHFPVSSSSRCCRRLLYWAIIIPTTVASYISCSHESLVASQSATEPVAVKSDYGNQSAALMTICADSASCGTICNYRPFATSRSHLYIIPVGAASFQTVAQQIKQQPPWFHEGVYTKRPGVLR